MASLAGQVAWLGYGLYAAGPHSHGQDVPTGSVLDPGDRRSRRRRPAELPERLRANGRTARTTSTSQLGTDYNLTWWNPDLSGVSNAVNIPGKGKHMYVDGAKRYAAGAWPTKPVTGFFDAYGFDRRVRHTVEPHSGRVHRLPEHRRERHAGRGDVDRDRPLAR